MHQAWLDGDSDKHVEVGNGVEPSRPWLDDAPKEAETTAKAAAFTALEVVGIVDESFTAHEGGEFSL